jgi:hypothetical protein
MLAVDLYFIVRVGVIDRAETERYLDEAEHWLTSWKAPVIHIVTFGYINPRQMVYVEVRKAVEEGRGLLHRTLWWMSAQAGLRILYGLLLWVAWALHSSTPAPPLATGPETAILRLPTIATFTPGPPHVRST